MRMLDAKTSALMVIDLQQKLLPVLHEGEETVRNTKRLIDAARLLDVRVMFSEQNPEKLGPTLPELEPSDMLHPKMTFSAMRTWQIGQQIPLDGRLVIAGCEAHVCVLQTVLDLIDAGREVFVVADAIASRKPLSKEVALQRMKQNGAEIVTTEMVIFEWLDTAENPHFKAVSALIK